MISGGAGTPPNKVSYNNKFKENITGTCDRIYKSFRIADCITGHMSVGTNGEQACESIIFEITARAGSNIQINTLVDYVYK